MDLFACTFWLVACILALFSGNYGFSGMQEFSNMAKEAGICEATSEKISNNADDEAFDKVRRSLIHMTLRFCISDITNRLLLIFMF